MNEKQRYRKARDEIRRVLLAVWDPIGIRDIPEAQDEYDDYLEQIYRLLFDAASESRIIEYLYWVETEQMGLSEHDRNSLLPVANALKGISL